MEKDTILYVLTKSQEYLGQKQIPNPRLDAELILSDLLKLERIKLYSNFDRKLTESEKDSYREKIRARGEFKPVSYIIGKKHFYKSQFIVNNHVLIPRPETEELVEWVCKSENLNEPINLLDVCTGSGCIGISIKKDFPLIHLTLSDISKDALAIAKQNSDLILGENSVEIIQSDLFGLIDKKFQVIVSNPPYIPIEEKNSLMADVVKYEPHLALFIDNPDHFYSKLLSEVYSHLTENGVFYFEIHQDWASKVANLGLENGFKEYVIKKDLSQKERFVKLTK